MSMLKLDFAPDNRQFHKSVAQIIAAHFLSIQ